MKWYHMLTLENAPLEFRSDEVVGLCHQHSSQLPLKIKSEADLEYLRQCVASGKTHIATEFSAFAVASLGDKNYSARMIAGLPHCKLGTRLDQSKLLKAIVGHW